MKTRPILMSAPMVRAILDGSKTQTRRVAKVNNTDCKPGFITPDAGFVPRTIDEHRKYCPYGQPGDRLWVKETWRIGAWNHDLGAIAVDYRADGECRKEWLEIPNDDDGEKFNKYWIQCTEDSEESGANVNGDGDYEWPVGDSPCRWRPSIHMPRWASRITLEITAIRVERLQDISEDDAIAEGIEGLNEPTGGDDLQDYWRDYSDDTFPWLEAKPVESYQTLWESINGAGSWALNPWVWVVEFTRVDK